MPKQTLPRALCALAAVVQLGLLLGLQEEADASDAAARPAAAQRHAPAQAQASSMRRWPSSSRGTSVGLAR